MHASEGILCGASDAAANTPPTHRLLRFLIRQKGGDGPSSWISARAASVALGAHASRRADRGGGANRPLTMLTLRRIVMRRYGGRRPSHWGLRI